MPALSFWEKESFFEKQDIIIIGGGFAGLWSALHLKLINPGYKITILERGHIPEGASTRNAGFSCFGSPSELIEDAGTMGPEKMWDLVDRRYKGLLEIRKFFTGTEIGYEADGGFECFTKSSGDWETCNQKLSWLNDGLHTLTGEQQVFQIADHKLLHFGFRGFEHIIENKLEGALHPGKLVKALIHKIQCLGVQIFNGMNVLRYEEDEDEVKVFTDRDLTFYAARVLLCTNAFTPGIVPSIDIIPNRGQVLLTEPIEGLSWKGTFHFQRGFYYFRNLGDRILLGGARNIAFEEEQTLSFSTTSSIQSALEDFIRVHLLPEKPFTISDRWSGIMGMGSEKSPIVSALSRKVYCCVRMSGMGVALAPIVAKEAALLVSRSITS